MGRYADSLRPGFLKLMSAFGFEQWIIRLVAQFCNFQEYVEGFDPANVQQAHVFEFFTAIVDMEPPAIERTDRVLVLIQRLIKRFSRTHDVSVLQKAQQDTVPVKDVGSLLQGLVHAVRTGDSWREKFDSVAAVFDGGGATIKAIEEAFGNSFPGLINEGDDTQKRGIIGVVIALIPKLRKVSVASTMEAFAPILIAGEWPWTGELVEAFAKAMGDVKVMAQIIQLIDSAPAARIRSLSALLMYLTEAPPQRLLPIQKVIVKKLSPLFIDEDQEIRRLAVKICAEFQRKIPTDFAKRLGKLAPTQQRLIVLQAERSAPRRRT
jgi:hypothetical protein